MSGYKDSNKGVRVQFYNPKISPKLPYRESREQRTLLTNEFEFPVYMNSDGSLQFAIFAKDEKELTKDIDRWISNDMSKKLHQLGKCKSGGGKKSSGGKKKGGKKKGGKKKC